MAAHYQKFLIMLTKWPVNQSRKSRDYASHLRSLLKQQNENGDFFLGKPNQVPKKIDSLGRLAADRYRVKYPPILKQGASGMEKDDVAIVLSDEFIEYFNSNRGFLDRFKK